MTATTTAPVTRGQSTDRPTVRLPMPRRLRQAVLTLHIVAAGSWVGIDVLVAVLVGTGRLAPDAATRGLAYQALGTFVALPMLVTALVCLGSGLLLGWSSRWGVLRYWWVLVKLAVTVVLTLLILGVLAPGMPDVVEAGRVVSAGGPPAASLETLVYPPTVSLTTLGIATVLSVFRPWGKLRGGRRRTSRARD